MPAMKSSKRSATAGFAGEAFESGEIDFGKVVDKSRLNQILFDMLFEQLQSDSRQ